MTKIVKEQLWGALMREGKAVYHVKLDVTVKEVTRDRSHLPIISRAISAIELNPTQVKLVENGFYILRYDFDGQQHQISVRVQDGILLDD
jgi:hypothetical protein